MRDRISRVFVFVPQVPSAYPRYEYTKHVSVSSMHSFTLFQFSMLVILFTLTPIFPLCSRAKSNGRGADMAAGSATACPCAFSARGCSAGLHGGALT